MIQGIPWRSLSVWRITHYIVSRKICTLLCITTLCNELKIENTNECERVYFVIMVKSFLPTKTKTIENHRITKQTKHSLGSLFDEFFYAAHFVLHFTNKLIFVWISGNGYQFVWYCEHTTGIGHDEILERQTYYT